MKPGLAQFESEQKSIPVVLLNMDERENDQFTQYGDHFEGRSIPYTVLVDSEGEKVKAWTGFKSYQELVQDIAALQKS